MAAPTAPAFLMTSPIAGASPITQVDDAARHPLGTIIKAQDGTYGEGEFMYLKGVALTVAGDLVTYDSKAGTTVRVLDDTGDVGPVAVAMAALVAGKYGWYQINGSAVVNTTATAAVGQAYISGTAGQITSTVVADDAIIGMAITVATSGGQAVCQLSRPTLGAPD